MAWIVIGEEKGKIKLVSKKPNDGEVPGLLPKGSFLTVESQDSDAKFILRVDDSYQHEPYSPSPMIIDMDLSGLFEDRKCQNIIYAYRIKDISERADGKIDFIPPQSIARRSNQEEINSAMGSFPRGPIVFPATVHAGQNQLLVDDNLNYLTVKLPDEMFFYQMQICGKTGSGKTIAMKYLAQYFVEELEGAVLAINVKDVDFLMMDKPSDISSQEIVREWDAINGTARGIDNCTIYYPANTNLNNYRGINHNICTAVTLNVHDIEPEALLGLLQNISDIGAQNFPDIFRYWQDREMTPNSSFVGFANYFANGTGNPTFATLNSRGDLSSVTLHAGTFNNIQRNLNASLEFFDNQNAVALSYGDILSKGKLSVINVAGSRGIQFGSILLRHLLKQIVRAKSERHSDIPILLVIDEVHQFYNTESSREALGELDTICRTGRSQKIGVIFSSQNQEDLPRGLSSVINSKFFFKSDGISKTLFNISNEEIQTLKTGYAVANIHDLPQLKVLKFPLSFAGAIKN